MKVQVYTSYLPLLATVINRPLSLTPSHLLIYADAPSDFVDPDVDLTFDANNLEHCVDIIIVNDLIVEEIESFIVTLEKTSDLDDRVFLDPRMGMIAIRNDDGESKVTIGIVLSVVLFCKTNSEECCNGLFNNSMVYMKV